MAKIRMKFVLFVSIMLLVFGILIIAGSVFLYLTLDKALNDFEPVANSYVTSAISTIKSVSNTITVLQPSLTNSSEIAEEATGNLTNIGSEIATIGNELLEFNISGVPLLASEGDYAINVGSQIQSLVPQVQTIITSLNSTNTQIENIQESLGSVEANLENTETLLPSYFNQAHQTVLLVTGVVGLFGLSISLGGGSVLRLRREINKNSDQVLSLARAT